MYFTTSLVFIVLYCVGDYINIVLIIYSIIYIIIYHSQNFSIFSLIALFHLHYNRISPVTSEKIGSKSFLRILLNRRVTSGIRVFVELTFDSFLLIFTNLPILDWKCKKNIVYPFHATGFFLYPLKTTEN